MTCTQRQRNELLRDVDHRRRLPAPAVRVAIRQAAGVSRRQLARAIGVSPTALGYWEHGQRTPSRQHVGRYVGLLADLARRPGIDWEADTP
jgi:DNA-binding transcriptional regulator YiaG